ncbi:serine protease [Paenibacillus sp. GCM10028914]|uniref:S1 family peptidase n=1 Tax=Paenibacillus sp. GCM10028914 TaxID=3273416 RepID=UPI00361F713B
MFLILFLISREVFSIRNDELNDPNTPADPVNETETPVEWEEEFWNLEDDNEEDELNPPPKRTWIKKTIILMLAILPLGNLIAFIPQIYNLPTLRFLKKDSQLSQDELIQHYKEAVVNVSIDNRKGTGFNIAPNGLIITNQHVMDDDKAGIIQFLNGETYLADVIVSDSEIDISILKIRDHVNNLPTLQLETEIAYQEGDPIHVIGNPLAFYRIATEGTVIGLTPEESRPLPMLMIQAPIHSGNSGSPVINNKGNVIAVVYATTTTSQGDQSITVGLAIPIDYLEKYEKIMFQ